MNLEIERKFLLKNNNWKKFTTKETLYTQGYLNNDKNKTIRVRTSSDKAFLTIKGGNKNSFSHSEFEYEIPLNDGKIFLSEFCDNKIISKTRYIVPIKNSEQKWEIDIFHEENEGLIIAEIELKSEDENFEKPEWLGEEVTYDSRYKNAKLIENPFKNW
ncbi:MAG: CYTH domain-containing protein [Candidatus Nomurabacteria bacterium]